VRLYEYEKTAAMRWLWPGMWANERGGWWRFLVTLAVYVIGAVLGMFLFTAIWIGGLKQAMSSEPAYVQDVVRPLGTVLIGGLGLAGCLIGLRFVHHKPASSVFSDGRPFGFGLAVQSAAMWILLWFAGTISLPNGWEILVRRAGEIPPFWWPVLCVALFSAMAVGRTAEEVLFRGYLQTRVAVWVRRPWLAVCVSTLTFAAMHRGNTAAYIAIALFGLAFGAASIRVGTLAPMVGMHTAHDTLESFWHPSDTNAAATWWDVAFVAVALSIWFGWLLWITRTKPPNMSAASNLRPAGQSDGSGKLSAPKAFGVAADRAFPAASPSLVVRR
jgi:membrane protease YdiL (CAAX protease family)